jgi:hypothetical protein
MSRRLFVVASCLGLLAVCAFVRPAAAQELSKPVEVNPADIQWVWGEVVSVDAAEKSVTVKYLDYDTDEEKTMKIFSTDSTSFEEMQGLDGLKAADTVSVEYVTQEGRSLAKIITLEKVEETEAAEPQPVPEKVGSGPVTETEGPAAPAQPAADQSK